MCVDVPREKKALIIFVINNNGGRSVHCHQLIKINVRLLQEDT